MTVILEEPRLRARRASGSAPRTALTLAQLFAQLLTFLGRQPLALVRTLALSKGRAGMSLPLLGLSLPLRGHRLAMRAPRRAPLPGACLPAALRLEPLCPCARPLLLAKLLPKLLPIVVVHPRERRHREASRREAQSEQRPCRAKHGAPSKSHPIHCGILGATVARRHALASNRCNKA